MDKAKAQRFTQFLIERYGEDGAKKKIQKIQKTGKVDEEDIKAFAASEQKQQEQQVEKKAHGAKLNYFKSLKNQCAEDEEIVYFKKGGSVTCGCKKKEDGGQVTTAKEGSAIAKFKEARKMQKGGQPKIEKNDTVHINGKPYSVTYSDGTKRNPKSPFPKYSHQQYVKDRDNKTDKEAQKRVKKIDRVTKDEEMKKGGTISKFKKAKCGSKLKKHLQGGSLNGIPFIKKELLKKE